MKTIERAGYLAHAKTANFSRQVAKAKTTVQEWLLLSTKPYIAFSGGKDSTVLLHLVRSLSPDILAVFGDDEWHLPETLEFLNATPNLHRIASSSFHCDWFTAWEDGPGRVPGNVEWVGSPDKNDSAGFWAEREAYDGVALGLRAEENSYRKVHLKTYGMIHQEQKHGLWQCNPLAWWNLNDVWAYILVNDLGYNKAYDRMSDMEVLPKHQRIGPFANSRALPMGQLAILHQGWPEQFAAFVNTYPDARRWG